jgi:hypothetical protein
LIFAVQARSGLGSTVVRALGEAPAQVKRTDVACAHALSPRPGYLQDSVVWAAWTAVWTPATAVLIDAAASPSVVVPEIDFTAV